MQICFVDAMRKDYKVSFCPNEPLQLKELTAPKEDDLLYDVDPKLVHANIVITMPDGLPMIVVVTFEPDRKYDREYSFTSYSANFDQIAPTITTEGIPPDTPTLVTVNVYPKIEAVLTY